MDETTRIELDGMDFALPSSWSETDDGGDSSIYYAPSVGGLAMVVANSGVDFVSDGSDEVDYLLETLDGDVTQVVSEKSEGTCGEAKTYTVDIERSDADELHKGYAKFFASGHSLYMFVMVVPESDFDNGYDAVLQAILDSVYIENSSEPLGTDSSDETQGEVANTTNENQLATTCGEGTYKVGTDIEAGEYKLTSTSTVAGYWEVTNSSNPDADIVSNDNFEGTAYVTVTDGQYLKLKRCTAEKV